MARARNPTEWVLALTTLLALVLPARPARGQAGMVKSRARSQIRKAASFGTSYSPFETKARASRVRRRLQSMEVIVSWQSWPGEYALIVERDGFARVEEGEIDVTIGLGLRRDFRLSVGGFTQRIVVRGNEPGADTTTAETGGLVAEQQIERLPINSRQYLSLALLMPGTSLDAKAPNASTCLRSSSAHAIASSQEGREASSRGSKRRARSSCSFLKNCTSTP
jgi:hypothetical protein